MFLNMRKSITLLLLLLGFGMGASAVKGQLMITEIMYRSPIGTFNDSLEYIEIYNNTSAPIDMTGYSLAVGVGFTYPSFILGPGEFSVVCKSSGVVVNYFGQVSADVFDFGGFLNDTGEPIVLRDAGGVTIDSVRYSNTGVWPAGGNGDGHSISFCHHSGDNNDGSLWESSSNPFPGAVWQGTQLYGSPGACCSYLDITPPTLLSHKIITPTRIGLQFSEPISNPSLWENHFTGTIGALVTSRGATSDSVILDLSGPLQEGQYYELILTGIQDTSCNGMVNDSIQLIFNRVSSPLTICEIMYDDPTGDDSLEFIEIINATLNTVPVGGFRLSGDIVGTIPPRNLQSNERMVIARFPNTIERVFGISNVIGWQSGTLGNSSGDLKLLNDLGLNDSLVYTNSSPWPMEQTELAIV